ncbi:hypothetical protein [Streptomyces antarcticus]|uniref:hypothetical protein n=1 Tax=Streptomyces antarcticus TaxID=2996458 RepID=UPI0022710D30|nr:MULTISPECIES: hypothetical protein [unclassified Streptomyces]MCY0945001.1 hypothetical protein [Streptomyces sp. H34-AA3]MCY0951528.1 hypothetical protein [Streptomyces sp. H27-S2]MCZ4082173.1 hypothetical protein [Streptomyces sp. H34-S5]
MAELPGSEKTPLRNPQAALTPSLRPSDRKRTLLVSIEQWYELIDHITPSSREG